MTITQLEKEIIKAIIIESNEDSLKDLIKFVRKLFKEYKEE